MNKENNLEINGSEQTDKDLGNFGIQEKHLSDPILDLLQNYKSYISKTKLQDEVYKWELLKKFKGRPDTNALNFETEYKSINFGNLIYHLSFAVGKHICREKSEEFRQLFVQLFNETTDLTVRIKNFNEKSLILYRSLGAEKGHHQDERAVSVYLTFHNPEKYTFYQSSFYIEFYKLMGVPHEAKNGKYAHYLQLLNQFINDYIVPDAELIETVKSLIPQFYDGTNHLLLAQDILNSMLKKVKVEVNYWTFQGNPKIYDFKAALNRGNIDQWTATSHRDKMKIGDKVIFWLTGADSGCYALGEITREAFENEELQDEYWIREDNTNRKVGVKITHNCSSNPILKENIDSVSALKHLKVGHQGTNFVATKEEFETLLQLIEKKQTIKYWLYAPGENAEMWGEFYEQGVMSLGWNQLEDLNLYNSKEKNTKKLKEFDSSEGSKKNDAKANFDFLKVMNIGDVVFVKKGISKILGYGIVTSDYYFDKSKKEYQHLRNVDWKLKGEWDANHKLVPKTLTNITKFPTELSGYNFYHERLFAIMNGLKINNVNINQPINQILYGPPGTGKTFTLKDAYFPKYTSQETSLSAEQHFKNVVSECSWWQVIAIALIQTGKCKVNDLINNKWIIQKSELSNSNTIRPTIWGQLQSHTIESCEFVNVKSKQQPYIFNKTYDSFWEVVDEEVKEKIPELFEIIDSVENFNPSSDKLIERYVFTTFHQSYSYEDFIEGIKPVMVESEIDGNVAYRIEDGIFKQLCKKAEMDPENQYAIFIDEINRGNVSAIFGELITLIEEDKRKGSVNAISALLPYSKKQFSVPKNVDIYGTMNTADRSVEALDTALRRRFLFKEMLPMPELLRDRGHGKTGKVGDIDLVQLLTVINDRIEALIDRDHTIGHAFFMEVDSLDSLRNVFANKVIPLLQEYFYGDYAKMEMVIGPRFFNSEKRAKKVMFAVQNEDVEIATGSYELVNILAPDFDLEAAINQLFSTI